MAIDAFLELLDAAGKSAVQGEALDKKFHEKHGMELYKFDLQSQIDPNSTISQVSGSDTNLFSFKVTKPIDEATPDLLMAYAKYWKTRKETWPKARVTMRKAAGAKQMKFLVLEFEGVYIKSWSLDSQDGDELPEEDIDFAFRTLRISYWPQAHSGGKMSASMISAGWNLAQNEELK